MRATRKAGKGRRRLRRFLAWPVLLGLALFFGSNVIIDSSWGRGKIAGKLRGLNGFDWSVGKVSWSPWGGVRLGDVEMRIPQADRTKVAPVLTVEALRVRPYWRRLLLGEAALREAVVENPVGEVPLELLAAMSPAQGPAPVAVTPTSDPVREDPGGPGAAGEAGERTPEVAEGPAKPEQDKVRKKKEEARVALPGRLVVHGGRLRIFSLAAPQWSLQLSGCAAELPVAGPEARGWVSSEELRVGEWNVLEGLRSEVTWKKPVLTLPETGVSLGGLPVLTMMEMVVGRRPRVVAQVAVPPGRLDPVPLPGFAEIRLGAEQLQAAGTFQGELARPSSWRGSFVAEGTHLSAEGLGRLEEGFDRGRLAVNFQGGILQVVDGRLVGESLSILGNGAIRWDGQMLGVLRLVGDWEHEEISRRIAAGALLWNQGAWMRPLETPDRYYRDIHVEGPLGKARVDLGRDQAGMDLAQLWGHLRRFTEGEQLEEEQGVPGSWHSGPMMLKQ